MLRQRLATAAVGIPFLVALILAGDAFVAAGLTLVVAVAYTELAGSAGLSKRAPEVLLGAALAAALVPATYANHDVQAALLAAAIIMPLLSAVVRVDVTPTSVLPAFWLVLPAAALYTGWLGQFLLLIRRLPHGEQWLFVLLFGTFATDTAAYAVGRLLGRHQLAPRVSPAKTIEGGLGGLAGAVAAVAALHRLFNLPGNPGLVVGLGVVLGIAAELGDLAESAVKRRLGVKDMGSLFPGHGGMLDRLDSLLFAGVMVYFIVRWAIISQA